MHAKMLIVSKVICVQESYKLRDGREISQQNLKELSKLGFRRVGDFFFDGKKVRFFLTKCKNKGGSYAFVVDQIVKYVGVTKNTLYARMNGYKNPGPSQETNKRINTIMRKINKVEIYFLPESEIAEFTTIIRRKEIEKQIPADMHIFERFLISNFEPEWNRG
jgi:transcriptional regulator with XRE-family HTH domain